MVACMIDFCKKFARTSEEWTTYRKKKKEFDAFNLLREMMLFNIICLVGYLNAVEK